MVVRTQHRPRPQPGLIDIAGPARAAYATNRRMSLAYRGPLFKVRRASDNAEQDIYPNPITGWCSVTQLVAFCAGTNGFLKTAYDLTGNGRHVTQATTTKQPKVYDSATGTILNGRNVCMRFDGVDDKLEYLTDSLGFSGDHSLTYGILLKLLDLSVSHVLVAIGSTNKFYPMYFGSSQAGNSSNTTVLATKWRGSATNQTNEQIYVPNTSAGNLHFNVIQHGVGELDSALVWRQNGASIAASDTDTHAFPSIDSAGFAIGGFPTVASTSVPLKADVASFVAFPSKLAGVGLTNLEAQLSYLKAA
jgi:hypothetical protein